MKVTEEVLKGTCKYYQKVLQVNGYESIMSNLKIVFLFPFIKIYPEPGPIQPQPSGFAFVLTHEGE